MYIWKSLTYHDRVEHFTKGSGTVFNTGKVADPADLYPLLLFFSCIPGCAGGENHFQMEHPPFWKIHWGNCVCISHIQHIHIYTYIPTHLPTYMHACMHTDRHTYIHPCMHAYIHTSFYLPQTQRDLRLFEFIVILREVYMYSSKHEICGLNVKWYKISCLYVIGRFTGHTSVTSRLHPNCSWTSTIPIDLQVWVMLPNSMCETPNY